MAGTQNVFDWSWAAQRLWALEPSIIHENVPEFGLTESPALVHRRRCPEPGVWVALTREAS
eukprot:12841477-Alexandrium_andersonii.AAC.1